MFAATAEVLSLTLPALMFLALDEFSPEPILDEVDTAVLFQLEASNSCMPLD
jgi:hypothetical protein